MAKQDEKELGVFSIEELKIKGKLNEAIFQGVITKEGWTHGKMVTEKEFLEAVEKFLKSPLRGQGQEAKKDA